MNIEKIIDFIMNEGMSFSLKVLAALAAWIIGRWLISVFMNLIGSFVSKTGKIDPTLSKYLNSIITGILNIVLVLSILDIFGVKTTSFSVLLAGAGLAIGTAWGGLLTHFAAGVFMQILRPYKVGDFISAGGTLGTVKELGLFGTTIITPDNVITIIGNNKIFSDNIQNFSALPVRRVDCVAKIANTVNVEEAISLLKKEIPLIANVAESPAPDIEILNFTAEGPVLCVRPYTHTDNYWQVYFDTNKKIVSTFGKAGYPTPETPQVHRNI
ncbi:MAG: mechanosensitive ion channel family protein [Candidatus Sericytochromatia bacterium]